MRNLTIGLVGALGIAIVAIAILARDRANNTLSAAQLRVENQRLTAEIEALHQEQAEAEARRAPWQDSRSQVDANELIRLRQAERELLRLRNEIGRLREKLNKVSPEAQEGIVLKGKDRYDTPESYRPPVEITLVAKTDSTNLRMAYAADQLIFNWELNESELRVDGGPATGQHRENAGRIPVDEYVTIKWIVTPGSQEVYANGELRFAHNGDYSQIDRPVSVFPAWGSTVTVKALEVKRLAATAR
jgi:hypothetical protein